MSFSKRVWALSTQRQISLPVFFHAKKNIKDILLDCRPLGSNGRMSLFNHSDEVDYIPLSRGKEAM